MDSCTHVGTLLHELGHALGLWHEHSRPDRDQHIDIVWDHILPGKEGNFQVRDHWDRSLTLPYDYSSIMHYGPFTFSIADSLPTIIARTPSDTKSMGQRSQLSDLDIAKTNTLYNCLQGACASNPCKRGTCTETPSFYKCTCFEGWHGANCSHHGNSCVNSPCGAHGDCRADNTLLAGYKCLCKEGYIGQHCATQATAHCDGPCLNGGWCSEYSTCQCQHGYHGNNCEIADWSCHGNSSGECQGNCQPGYTGPGCDTKAVLVCNMDHGVCPWMSTYGHWSTWAGPTPSRGTGPRVDHTTFSRHGYYLYTESSGALLGERAVLEVGPMTRSDISCKLFFAYHMHGDTMGSLTVNVVDTNLLIIWVKSGNQGNQWKTVLMNIGIHDVYRIQIVSETGPFWRSDIAIDDVMIFGECGEFISAELTATTEPPVATATSLISNYSGDRCEAHETTYEQSQASLEKQPPGQNNPLGKSPHEEISSADELVTPEKLTSADQHVPTKQIVNSDQFTTAEKYAVTANLPATALECFNCCDCFDDIHLCICDEAVCAYCYRECQDCGQLNNVRGENSVMDSSTTVYLCWECLMIMLIRVF